MDVSVQQASDFVEKDGLRVRARFLKWTTANNALFEYSLTMTDPDAMWVLQSPVPLTFYFSDTKGNRIPKGVVRGVQVNEDLLRRKRPATVIVKVPIPERAGFVLIELGRSELRTKPIAIPQKEKEK
jgi:hypothetical protein